MVVVIFCKFLERLCDMGWLLKTAEAGIWMCSFKRRLRLAGSGWGRCCRENICAVRQRLWAAIWQQDFSIVVRGMVSGFNRFDLWMLFYPANSPTDGRSRKSRTNTEITVGLYDFCFKPHKIHISCTDINKIHMNFCDFQRKSIWNHANCGVFIDKIARFQWDLSQSRKNQRFFEEIWRKLLTIYIYIYNRLYEFVCFA